MTVSVGARPFTVSVIVSPAQIELTGLAATGAGTGSTTNQAVSSGESPQQSVININSIMKQPATLNCELGTN